MKKLIAGYKFDPIAKTIDFLDEYSLSQFLLITNVTTNTIIYNFADPSSGGSVSGDVLTLDFNTAAMSATDELQIFVDVEDEGVAALLDLQNLMVRLLNATDSPRGYDKSLGRSRITALIESGTITAVTTVGTVTTVAALTNLLNIGNTQAQLLVNGQNTSAWQSSVRSRIT